MLYQKYFFSQYFTRISCYSFKYLMVKKTIISSLAFKMFGSVSHAIDLWLKDVYIKHRLKDITKKLRRDILQIKYEGMLSIVETAELEKIGELWIKLLYSLGEKKAIDYTLMLYHYEQISLRMVKRIISRSFCG